ncbi:hypothetical protein GCM10009092_30260 [Bowmanella denitrificans]|uniref:Activator of Hsp90 ATPase homologue 1/2-like C-terminal domain-containing protein n=1 Tax=Bowmanella denitrificans TaxID=366582 RepID=A0ABP3H888_9ALTE
MYQFTLSVKFDAPLPRLFDAWHKTELMQQWWAPGDMLVAQIMSSFQKGGKFRLVMQDSDFNQHVVMGEYLDIVENQTLVFSWQWQDSDLVTTVSLDFAEINQHTSELTLTHSGFADQEMADDHQVGWIGCLEKLSLLTL